MKTTQPMTKLGTNAWITIDSKNAIHQAMQDTGKEKQQIIREAIEDWLIAHGYIDEAMVR